MSREEVLGCPYGSVACGSLGREMHFYVYQRQRYSILYRHLRRHSWDPTEAWRLESNVAKLRAQGRGNEDSGQLEDIDGL